MNMKFLRKYLYKDLTQQEFFSLLNGNAVHLDCANYLAYETFQLREDRDSLLNVHLYAIGSNDDHYIGSMPIPYEAI